MKNAFRVAGAAIAALMAVPVATQPASAQSYPSKTVRIIVPFGAGGAVDILSRAVGQKLSADWRKISFTVFADPDDPSSVVTERIIEIPK